MRKLLSLSALWIAMVLMACLPSLAQSYYIEGEGILSSPDWSIRPAANGPPILPSLIQPFNVSEPYSYGGQALKLVDGLTGTDGKIFIQNKSAFGFGAGVTNKVTAVVRVKTTGDASFNGSDASTSSSAPWSRTFVLYFANNRGVGLAIRPTAAAVTNNTSSTVYGSIIPGDNTHYHTWSIVAYSNAPANTASFDVYRDGVLVTSGSTPSSIESPLERPFDGIYVSTGPNNGTGAWDIDYVGYKIGEDPGWRPVVASQQITGSVVDANTPSTKISGANVNVNGVDYQSDGSGVYSVTGLEPEEYTVSASAPGYFPRSYTVPVTIDNAVTNQDLKLIPTGASATVFDTFTRADTLGDLGVTEDANHYPWVNTGEETTAGIQTNQLYLSFADYHGVSVGGGFLPANVDISADCSLLSGAGTDWLGLAYRQANPNTYDGNWGQDPNQAGYLVWCTADGTAINLWRNGLIATAATNIDWSVPHTLRVIAFGNYHCVLVDNKVMLTAIDGQKLTGGYVGIFRDKPFMYADNFRASVLPAGSSLGVISGTVSDASNPSTKIAGAYVTLSDGRVTTSDSLGAYSFSLNNLNGGSVLVRAAGYLDKTVAFEPGLGANTVNVSLTPDPGFYATIGEAKEAAVDSEVSVAGKVITSMWSNNTVYIEEPGRSAGIKVTLPATDASLRTKTGVVVNVRGHLRSDPMTGELSIEASSWYEPPVARIFLEPLHMNGRAVLNITSGADVTGLAVEVSGRVISVTNPNDFVIDDGSGNLSVKIESGITLDWPNTGDFVTVQGVVSLDGATPATATRVVKPWNSNVNQLGNGGFEPANPETGWGWAVVNGAAADHTYVTDVFHSGAKSVKFTNATPLTPNVYGTFWFVIGAQYAQEYELSYWIKGENVTSSVHWTDWGSFVFNIPEGTYDWQKESGVYRFLGAADGPGVNTVLDIVRLNITNTMDALYLDDVEWRFANGTVKVEQTAPASFQ